jgi:glycerol-3-phosphate dehydrogenase subunit B
VEEFAQPCGREIAEAIEFFREMVLAAGCPFEGGISQERLLPTILGDFKRVALAPYSVWNAEPRSDISTAVVGVRELSSLDANFMAERLSEQARRRGVSCAYIARQISLAHIFGASITTLRLATRFDSDAGFRAELAGALRSLTAGFDRVLVPGMLGLHSSAQQLSQFESEVGCSVGELPTLPASVPGLRLFHRLWRYLRERGVELFEGFPVEKVWVLDGCCTEIEIASMGRPNILCGEDVVLAAGQSSAALLGDAFAGRDEQMHPLNVDGSVMAWNLFVAESAEGKTGGDAGKILLGYSAGNLAAATRGRYEAG